jgi:two-component system chemotaxis response regulator CheB
MTAQLSEPPQIDHGSTFERLLLIGAAGMEAAEVVTLISRLPAGLPAPVLLAVHTITPGQWAALRNALSSRSKLPCTTAHDQQPLEAGRVFLAPPDRHLLVQGQRLRVVFGPKENRHRPALDALFRTGAMSFGDRAVAVLLCALSGDVDDGLFGLHFIGERGGAVVVPHQPDTPPPETLGVDLFRRIAVHHTPTPLELPEFLTQMVMQAERSRP